MNLDIRISQDMMILPDDNITVCMVRVVQYVNMKISSPHQIDMSKV